MRDTHRFLLYNIAYGTGSPRGPSHQLFTLHRYVRTTRHHFDRIRAFVQDTAPDIVGLVEADSGSFRNGRCNQVTELARALTHHSFATKYGIRSWCRYLPILRNQGNAVLARERLESCAHHFCHVGFKRLVVEATVMGVRIFLVHLALQRRVRAEQLHYVAGLIGRPREPVIVAGDFNTLAGAGEIDPLLHRTGLRNPNLTGTPTYPCWRPRREIDLVLCSPDIEVTAFRVLSDVRLSDHLPVVLDFRLR